MELANIWRKLLRYLTLKAKFASFWNDLSTPTRDVSLDFPPTLIVEEVES